MSFNGTWAAALMEISWSLLFKEMMLLEDDTIFEVVLFVVIGRESEVLFEGANGC